MSNVITAKECIRMMKESNGVEKIVSNQLIERLDVSIRRAVQEGKYKITVNIPTFLYGTPAFDRKEVENKVRTTFANNGFILKTVDSQSHTFDISWLNIDVDDEHFKPEKAVEDTFKKVSIP